MLTGRANTAVDDRGPVCLVLVLMFVDIFSVHADLLVINIARPITASNADIVIVCERDLIDLVSNFEPLVAAGRDREDLATDPVNAGGYNEASEEIQIIDIRGTYGDVAAIDGTGKPHNVDQDTGDVGRVRTPINTESEVVGATAACIVQLLDSEIPTTHEVVVGNHDARNRAQKHRVRRQIGHEVVSRR